MCCANCKYCIELTNGDLSCSIASHRERFNRDCLNGVGWYTPKEIITDKND